MTLNYNSTNVPFYRLKDSKDLRTDYTSYVTRRIGPTYMSYSVFRVN